MPRCNLLYIITSLSLNFHKLDFPASLLGGDVSNTGLMGDITDLNTYYQISIFQTRINMKDTFQLNQNTIYWSTRCYLAKNCIWGIVKARLNKDSIKIIMWQKNLHE